MVTEKQVFILRRLLERGNSISEAARICGISRATARRWAKGEVSMAQKKRRTYRTRANPFEDVWFEVEELLWRCPTLGVAEIFRELCRSYPDRFSRGQLRTLQRQVRAWRAVNGQGKEIFFPQEYPPGKFSQSDVTSMNRLRITIEGKPLRHLYFRLIFPYSNWETGEICFNENLETVCWAVQKCIRRAGGAASEHQADNLPSVVRIGPKGQRVVNPKYRALLEHYGSTPRFTRPHSPHQDGDVERAHGSFKDEIRNALLLRGSCDFSSIEQYQQFLREIEHRRQARVAEAFAREKCFLRPLPEKELHICSYEKVKVSRSSTIRLKGNVYSVHPRLIGLWLTAEVWPDQLVLYVGAQEVDRKRRLVGKGRTDINWRHVIKELLRKPGAFAHYRYREALFPSATLKLAYEKLKEARPTECDVEYLRILHLAHETMLSRVEAGLEALMKAGKVPELSLLKELVQEKAPEVPEVNLPPVDLKSFDSLLTRKEEQ